MRSKEVEVAIKILKNTNFEKYTYSCKKCSLEDYKNCYTENCHDKSKDTLLNYISYLEKDTVSKSVIRDKIKELEEERDKEKYITDRYLIILGQIEVLKSIIGA